jgi:nitrite reductase/ring-hydroxylating ferredoxin subunit
LNRIKVGEIAEFSELSPKAVKIGDAQVFVYRYKGKFYAYTDKCPHQGGPACEGDLRECVVGEIDENRLYVESVSKERFSIVCPWHGVEYDLETGECRTNRRLRLRHYNVILEGTEVLVEQ